MENWDEDFSTLKGPPKQHFSRRRSLSSWKADVPMVDGDLTIRKNASPAVSSSLGVEEVDEFLEDSDGDFAEEFEVAVRNRKPQVRYEDNLPDAFLSDSSTRSPGRASVSSAASASSAATSWGCDEDFGFDFDDDELPDGKMDLAARFNSRQERARAEANAEAQQLSANYAKTVTRNRFLDRKYGEQGMSDPDNDLLDLGLEQLTLRVKNGTVNKNITLQPVPNSTAAPMQSSPSKLLRGMRSIAQLPQRRSEGPIPAPKVRGAVSMLDFGKIPGKLPHQSAPHHNLYQAQTLQSNSHFAGPLPAAQRPLTAYREPAKQPSRHDMRKQKNKKVNLIRNPAHTLKRQERNGMVLNPQTGLWEGNDMDISRFDQIDKGVRPTLITKQSIDQKEIPKTAAPNGMLFDNRTLSWIYANEEEYDDPFAEIDNETPESTPSPTAQLLKPSASFAPSHSHSPSMNNISKLAARKSTRSSRIVTNESVASTTSFASSNFGRSSVARSETSDREVFEVTPRMAAEWRHADERFMRKFGKWIGGDEEKADALQSDKHFYEMVKNA